MEEMGTGLSLRETLVTEGYPTSRDWDGVYPVLGVGTGEGPTTRADVGGPLVLVAREGPEDAGVGCLKGGKRN